MKSKKFLLGVTIGIVLLGSIFSPVLAQEETKSEPKIAMKPVPGFKIKIWVDKGCGKTYYTGEKLTIYFSSNKDCYLTLFDFTPGGGVRLLLPNRYRKSNFFEANKVYAIPSKSDNFEFEVTPPPGREMIKAVATARPWWFISNKEILRYYKAHPKEKYPIISRSEEEFSAKFNEETKVIPRANLAMASCTFYVISKVVPKYGKIKITSSPSNAKVYLDGSYRGKTPLTISNVKVGEYQIKISKDDYYDWLTTVQVKQNVTIQVFAQLEPIPKTGSLYVTSSPCCARVFLDGIERGTAPITITDIEEGWHEVVIIKEYYRAYVEYLYIYAGEQSEVEADLERI